MFQIKWSVPWPPLLTLWAAFLTLDTFINVKCVIKWKDDVVQNADKAIFKSNLVSKGRKTFPFPLVSDVKWRPWHLKSPKTALFFQLFAQAYFEAPRYLALSGETHQWHVDSPHKGKVTRKIFPHHNFIMEFFYLSTLVIIHQAQQRL